MDGAVSPSDLASAAAKLGWSALALADANNLYGLPELVDACRAQGLKALAAASVSTGGISFRAYCLDRRGFSRLCGILTRALAVEVPRRRLRLPPELLEEEARDGEAIAFPDRGRERALGPYDPLADLLELGWEGLAIASEDPVLLRRLSGGGRLYAALPLGSPQEGTARAARELKLPLLAEHPARFARPEDEALWRLARAVEGRKTLAALGRDADAGAPGALAPAGAGLVSAARARDLLSAFPEAQDGARELAEEAAEAGSFFADPPVFPAYRGLSDEESYLLLRSLCAEGVGRRYGSRRPRDPRLAARLERELRIIRDKGFSAYFLVVRDIVSRCPRTCGRGSAASSLVSYLLGLTHVDPLEHDLFFERFLNEGRKDPPDIDIDFPWDERPAVLASVFESYEGRAAMVADHCRFSERSSLRESALALGMSEKDIAGAARALRLGTVSELPTELLAEARRIRGLPRYIGTHPGGVVITPHPITDYCHIQRSPAGLPVLGWEKDGAERAGLVKIDLLGNRSLAVLRDCLELVNREPGAEGAPLAWDFPGADADPETKALVESGRTVGIFYIESPATRQLLRKMGRVDYRLLVAASSIIRPAANKWIGEYVRRLRGGTWRRLAPAAEETLAETFGIMVYQEDVSRVAMAAAGFGAAEADGLRKVLTKKRKGGALEDFKGRFLSGCAAAGVSGLDAAELWDMMLSFDGYSFCKAHSASYALVSYRLAWMKAHYPAVFIAAVINNGGGFYGVEAYIGEARRLGIGILPPHVDSSGAEYLVEGSALRAGLRQVAELSQATIDRIVAARMELAAAGTRGFPGLDDFERLARPKLPELRALVRSGCLDGLPARPGGPPLVRPQALWALHRVRERVATGHGPGPELIEDSWEAPAWVRDYSESVRLADEARLLGLILSRPTASLFAGRAAQVAERRGLPAPTPAASLPAMVGRRACAAGICVAGKEVITKEGKHMAFYTFEDESGLFETVFFPQAYAGSLPTLEGNRAVLVVGTARSEYGAVSLHVEEAFGLSRMKRG
jgi:error-prone DNA polymerase